MNPSEIMAKHIVETQYEDLPDEAIERCKLRMLDSTGTMAAGIHCPGVDGSMDYFKSIGGSEEATVFYRGDKLPAAHAAFMNSLMLRSFDLECVVGELPGGKSEPFHLVGSSYPITMSMAEHLGASGKDAIAAMVLGDDLSARLVRGTGFSFDAGWDNTGTVNVIGGAAIAGKLLGLDAEQMKNAFGVALQFAGGTMRGVNEGEMTFKLHHAKSAMMGIFAAQLAKGGFSAEVDPLCGKFGYFDMFGGEGVNPDALNDDLGGFYSGDCVMKRYAVCGLGQGPVNAVVELCRENDLKSTDIEKIVAHPGPIAKLIDKPFVTKKEAQLVGLFNMRYVCAIAATQGDCLPQHHDAKYHADPEVQRLAGGMDIVYDRQFNDDKEVDIEIFLKDGRVLERHATGQKGSFTREPMSREEIMFKFWNSVDFAGVIGHEQVQQAVDMVDSFEDVANVADFAKLLVP